MTRLAATLALTVLATAVVGCSTEPTMPMTATASGGFNVERVGVFRDDLAYDGVRGVYVITQTSTGRQWVGVSGVGISELGAQSTGKVIVEYER
jgi:hypothetical protein